MKKAIEDDPPPVECPGAEAALKSLLGTKAGLSYCQAEPATLAPFSSGLVSLPSTAGRCVLQESLPPAEREMLADWDSRILKPEFSGDSNLKSPCSNVYWDPNLKSNHSEYVSFIRLLLKANMIALVKPSQVKCKVGMFFVRKKNGRLRLVIDARRVNSMCHPPQD